jgi:hypothetical protein
MSNFVRYDRSEKTRLTSYHSQNLGLGVLEEKTGDISETSSDESHSSGSKDGLPNRRRTSQSELRACNHQEKNVMRKLMGNKLKTSKPAIEEID